MKAKKKKRLREIRWAKMRTKKRTDKNSKKELFFFKEINKQTNKI